MSRRCSTEPACIQGVRVSRTTSQLCVLPVSEYPVPLEWGFILTKEKKIKTIKKNFYKVRSQDLPKSYYDTGNFVAIPVHHFKKKNIEFDKHYIGLEIPKHRSIDIDDIEDWKLAEKLYR